MKTVAKLVLRRYAQNNMNPGIEDLAFEYVEYTSMGMWRKEAPAAVRELGLKKLSEEAKREFIETIKEFTEGNADQDKEIAYLTKLIL